VSHDPSEIILIWWFDAHGPQRAFRICFCTTGNEIFQQYKCLIFWYSIFLKTYLGWKPISGVLFWALWSPYTTGCHPSYRMRNTTKKNFQDFSLNHQSKFLSMENKWQNDFHALRSTVLHVAKHFPVKCEYHNLSKQISLVDAKVCSATK